MRVLLIDNYDSFTYNLVQALAVLGAETTVVRNDTKTVDACLEDGPAAIVISPGPCTPAEAGISVEVVRAAASRAIPLLGVCLGHQAIGVAFGGRILAAQRLRHGKTSTIEHDGGGVFQGLPQGFTAMRYHSLVVEEPLSDELVRTAWTGPSEGAELMGLRHRTLPVYGVQFHPESFLTDDGPQLLANFLAIAGRASSISS